MSSAQSPLVANKIAMNQTNIVDDGIPLSIQLPLLPSGQPITTAKGFLFSINQSLDQPWRVDTVRIAIYIETSGGSFLFKLAQSGWDDHNFIVGALPTDFPIFNDIFIPLSSLSAANWQVVFRYSAPTGLVAILTVTAMYN